MNSEPSILLAYPSCFYYPVWMERVKIKTSQLLLASFLAREFDVTYADFEITIGRPNSVIQIKRYRRQVRQYLEKHPCDILALSCWTSLSYQATMVTAEIFRELYPDKLIVVGGYHPSARPEEFVTPDHVIDYVVCGEGELALREIARNVNKSGRPATTTILPGESIGPNDFVPYNWDLVDSFVKSSFPDGVSNIYLYLSRGCPFRCSFCMESLKDRRWAAYPPDEAVRVIHEAVRRFNAYAVPISDACFGMRRDWRRRFLEELVASRPDFWIVFETRAEYLDPEDIGLLAQLKLEIQFGLESASPEILKLMKKTRVPDKYLNRFETISRLCSEHEILHRANMIFNHPGETRRTLEETFAFIDRQLERRNSYLMWTCHGYMHFPGCDLDRDRDFYSQTYGSKFLKPNWWREDADQYESSMQFIPSADLDGDNVGLWQKLLKAREEPMKDTLAPRAFRFAANKYFLEWQNDYRFEQSKKTLDIH
ncbi:MAG: B12-binding domain-containing radical SAM protein [candidate division Zixibacteria bacterium]|nr:B12-binding domain-containing radical SAM protein [candidate division Zixibacteria bacterium]